MIQKAQQLILNFQNGLDFGSRNIHKNELITGSTSGAIARIVHPISPITLIPVNGLLFTANETITGSESGATATTDTNNEVGSREVTSNFVLDNGQRDNFYDIGRY